MQGLLGGSGGDSLHRVKGSPINGDGQLHTGLWLITWQSAPKPQTPGHGSTHFWLEQALSRGQSALIVHSGLHPPADGVPWNPGRHSQIAVSPDCLQIVFRPQGDGLQGFIGSRCSVNSLKML